MTDKELMELAKNIHYFRKHPSSFMEYVYNIKIPLYQKVIIDNIENIKCSVRNPWKKWNTYIHLCCAYVEMKDDEYITIASPNKVQKLSKTEFLEYLENYWKR